MKQSPKRVGILLATLDQTYYFFPHFPLIVNIIIAYDGGSHETIGSGSSCHQDKTLFDSHGKGIFGLDQKIHLNNRKQNGEME